MCVKHLVTIFNADSEDSIAASDTIMSNMSTATSKVSSSVTFETFRHYGMSDNNFMLYVMDTAELNQHIKWLYFLLSLNFLNALFLTF